MVGISSGLFVSAVVVAFFLLISLCGGRCESRLAERHQTQFFDDCMTYLEEHPRDGGIKREEFVSLIGSLSQGELVGSSDRLPLAYKATFNMHACLNGKDCIGNHATISISNSEERNRICSSIVSLVNEGTPLKDREDATGENLTTCPVDEIAIG